VSGVVDQLRALMVVKVGAADVLAEYSEDEIIELDSGAQAWDYAGLLALVNHLTNLLYELRTIEDERTAIEAA